MVGIKFSSYACGRVGGHFSLVEGLCMLRLRAACLHDWCEVGEMDMKLYSVKNIWRNDVARLTKSKTFSF